MGRGAGAPTVPSERNVIVVEIRRRQFLGGMAIGAGVIAAGPRLRFLFESEPAGDIAAAVGLTFLLAPPRRRVKSPAQTS